MHFELACLAMMTGQTSACSNVTLIGPQSSQVTTLINVDNICVACLGQEARGGSWPGTSW